MRKFFNGISGVILNDLEGKLTHGDFFIFINKTRDKINYYTGVQVDLCSIINA